MGKDADRYREQGKESRCGLWAETAESPCQLSLWYHIKYAKHFPPLPSRDSRDERQREAARRIVEENIQSEGETNRKEEGFEGRFISFLPLSTYQPPLCTTITLKGPGGHCLLLTHLRGLVTVT